MSLYAFGKVVGTDEAAIISMLRTVGGDSEVCFQPSVDDGDIDEMMKVPQLRGPGVVFSIYCGPNETDATRLWCDAMTSVSQCSSSLVTTMGDGSPQAGEEALRCFLDTRLGRACEGLFGLRYPTALALVDGGIESVLHGSALECLHRIAADVRRPWDQSYNRLYCTGF